MELNSQLKYRILMSNNLYLPKHFRKRYKERVSKSQTKMQSSVKNAYRLGKDIDVLEDSPMKRYLEEKANYHGGTCRIYKGFIYWFIQNKAITVYPISGIKK